MSNQLSQYFVDVVKCWILYWLVWHHPLEQWGVGEGKGGKSDETSRIFCDHVNFSEMNG